MSTILVSVEPEETRMAVTVQNRLCEYVVERNSSHQLVGDIFKGRINNVVRGIQAAFVDIGLEQNAFLYLEKGSTLTEGQNVLVQVEKDARGIKGPSVTQSITIAGHYLVLQPFNDVIGLSRRINSKSTRNRLKEFLQANKPTDIGLVARTEAAEASDEELLKEIGRLSKEWQVIEARYQRGKVPQLLYRELDLSVRIVRDYVDKNVSKIIVDNDDVADRLQELMEQVGKKIPVRCYLGAEDLFIKYKLNKQIENMSNRRVELECGGYLVIDTTEAMTVIDVNSGRYAGKNNMDETIMTINSKAAVEIARQLRLRDIGGIIVVDFIDMPKEEQKEEILKVLQTNLADDKMKPKVQDITKLNLVEITRKKARQNLSAVLYTTCPMCQGTGYVQSPETIGIEVRKRLRHMLMGVKGNRDVQLTVHPLIAEYMRGKAIKDMQNEFNCDIKVVPDATLQFEAFSILAD